MLRRASFHKSNAREAHIITLEIIVGALLALAGITHLRERRRAPNRPADISIRPDRPENFGDDCTWIAVAASSTEDVIRLLELDAPVRANWASGIGRVIAERAPPRTVFVSPPVRTRSKRQRVFIVGLPLPMPNVTPQIAKCRTLLEGLSATFGEAEYFTMTEHLGLYGWVKAIDGKIVRAFSFGEHGVAWNEGELTKDERDIGLRIQKDNFGTRDVSRPDRRIELLTYPKKKHIMELATRWSISPFALRDVSRKPGRGYLADLKRRDRRF